MRKGLMQDAREKNRDTNDCLLSRAENRNQGIPCLQRTILTQTDSERLAHDLGILGVNEKFGLRSQVITSLLQTFPL